MSKIFAIKTINNIKNDNIPKFHIRTNQTEKESDNLELNLSNNSSEILNKSKNGINKSSEKSKEYSLKSLSTELCCDSNMINNSDFIGENQEKKLLGKKIKYHFDIIKDSGVKNRNKFITYNFEKFLNQISPINSNYSNVKSDRINRKIKFKNLNLNEGRWSKEEHIKFIKALIDNGKKWKNIQKNVGSRSIEQTRSHAQKFLIRLKSIKNQEFDFTGRGIYSITDVINIIKNKWKGENKEEQKQYICDILIGLSELIPNDSKPLPKSIKSNKNNIVKHASYIHEKDNFNRDNILEKDKYKIDNDCNNNNEKINNKNIEEINNNISSKENKDKNENDETSENWNINENYYINSEYISEPSNVRLVLDNGYIYYIDDDKYHNYNLLSNYIKQYNFVYNLERSHLINRNFFS